MKMNVHYLFIYLFGWLQETHVIHTFKEDFYGEILSVVMVGYIRPERSYDSLGKPFSLPFVWVLKTIIICAFVFFLLIYLFVWLFSTTIHLLFSNNHVSFLFWPPGRKHTLTLFSFAHLCPNRGPHCCNHQWHRGGQGEARPPRKSQNERRQLLHQCGQLVFTFSHNLCSHVAVYYEWSLTTMNALTQAPMNRFLHTFKGCLYVQPYSWLHIITRSQLFLLYFFFVSISVLKNCWVLCIFRLQTACHQVHFCVCVYSHSRLLLCISLVLLYIYIFLWEITKYYSSK